MKKTGIVTGDIFMEHDTGMGHPECSERLAHIYGMIEKQGLKKDLVMVDLREVTDSDLLAVHTKDHLETVKSTAGRDSVHLDGDTPTSAKSYEAARLAAGTLLECVDRVMDGRLDNAFAFIRPPGHHAEANRAMGFCLFNNIAVAAHYAMKEHKLKKVMIIDWDVHHGNGTQHTFYDDPGALYFSSHRYPFYPGTGYFNEAGEGKGEGFTVNVPLPAGCGDSEFDAVYSRVMAPVARAFEPEMILLSAGFDIYRLDPLGGMNLTEEGVARLASIILGLADDLCGSKLVVTLEGGYHVEGQARCIHSILLQMLGKEPPKERGAEPVREFEQLIDKVAEAQKPYWPQISARPKDL
jgi:acetoin utilization deacetylase AcuC-like enzyme